MVNESHTSETEATLLICSETPQVVATQIASLTSIANYRLLPQAAQRIHDRYFDTPDRVLQAKKLALRVRESDAACWITLKGPSQETNWGGEERLEIEALWSQDALTRVIEELLDNGIKIQRQHRDFDFAHPLEVMFGLGLEVVQGRATHRQVRNVVPTGEGNSPVLAELAIDSVVYHFSGQDFCHHEVEIEAKVSDGSIVLKTVIESLVAMHGPALRKWHHSKLAIGNAIEKLLSEGGLEGLIDINNNLKPAAYEKIDDYLKRGTI